MRSKTIKIVLVEWDDATYHHDAETPTDLTTCWTVGFLLGRTQKKITIAAELHDDAYKRDINEIPSGCVKKVTILGRMPRPIEPTVPASSPKRR